MSSFGSASFRPIHFEHPFLVCPENQFAYSAAFEVASERQAPGTIVTLFGPTGTGKTHLIHEAARNFSRRMSSARIAHVSGLELVETIVDAIHHRNVRQVREEYSGVGLFICDGLDEIPDNQAVQEQLVALIDELVSNGGTALLASPKPPGELERLPRRFVDRCHAGTLAEIRLPSAASRRKLIEHYSATRRLSLPTSVRDILADSFQMNPRELFSLIQRLHEFGRVTRSPLSVELLDELLRGEESSTTVPLNHVAEAVAGEFGVSMREMQSDSRARRSLVSRQTAMLLAREITRTSLAEIGEFFGGRNHSTVVHACQRAQHLIAVDQEVASVVARIRQLLAARRAWNRQKPGDGALRNPGRTG